MEKEHTTFRVTVTLNFDIDASNAEAALDKAKDEAIEWLHDLESVENDEIQVREIKTISPL